MKKLFYTLMISMIVVCCFGSPGSDVLEHDFASPPDNARPWVYWFWVNGNITKEGITADLEAMKRVGLGGAAISSVANQIPPGRIDFLSPRWCELFTHCLKEANRLGLKIIMYNNDGASGSGGPWITEANSTKILTWSETLVKGPAKFSGEVKRPRTKNNYQPLNTENYIPPGTERPNFITEGLYRDIALFAFPAPEGAKTDFRTFSPELTASVPGFSQERVFDDNPETLDTLPLTSEDQPQWLSIKLDRPFTARSVLLESGRTSQSIKIQASDDGENYRTIYSGKPLSAGQLIIPQSYSFEPVKARHFRILFEGPPLDWAPCMRIAELALLGEYRIPDWSGKAGFARNDRLKPSIDPEAPVDPICADSLLDLTGCMGPDGSLEWDVPPGNWILLRLGYTSSGIVNGYATLDGGSGLECDKMSREAMDAHFKGFLSKIIKDAGSLAGQTLTGTWVESWEVGTQNWTPGFREEFISRRGYDPLPYLPTMVGWTVQSAEVSDRFLWDIRRTIADLIADNYYGHLAQLAGKHGMDMASEAYGAGNFENFQSASRAAIPMTEFWKRLDPFAGFRAGAKSVASPAHVYGRKIVAAEAFTASEEDGKWQNHPWELKALGDLMYCGGVNRFVIHRWVLQPWMDRWPGMTYGPWGIHFERTVTWFEQSRVWLDYLSRCQFLLQKGQFVADLCYYIGENAPCGSGGERVKGFDYDIINTEALLEMDVRDGRIITPGGMSYRLMILPDSKFMTPYVAEKINKLVHKGAIILGNKPLQSPSLNGYPECDLKIREIASKLWGDASSPGSKGSGKGRIYWGMTVPRVLDSIGLVPDIEFCEEEDATTAWIHVMIDDTDIYFLSNQTDKYVRIDPVFRASKRIPELWDPETGNTRTADIWESIPDGRTRISIDLDRRGSVFVVFRKPAENMDPIVSLTRNGIELPKRSELPKTVSLQSSAGAVVLNAGEPGNYEIRKASGQVQSLKITDVREAEPIRGPWRISYPAQYNYGEQIPGARVIDTLVSWPDFADEEGKYFSGTSVYDTEFTIPERLPGSDRCFLDLGRVEVLAEVILNGKNLGIVWKPPYRLEITDGIKIGQNNLEIRVTNLWPNRLIGDEHKPPYLTFGKLYNEGYPEFINEGIPFEWPDWVVDGGPVPNTGRVTFCTHKFFEGNDPLLPSGLLGPVMINYVKQKEYE